MKAAVRIALVVAFITVGLVAFEDSAAAHNGANGVISWADLHNNASGTGVLTCSPKTVPL